MSIQQIANSYTKSRNEETKQANFRLPKDLMDELKETSDATAVSQAVIVREAVREKLNEFKQTNKLIFSFEK